MNRKIVQTFGLIIGILAILAICTFVCHSQKAAHYAGGMILTAVYPTVEGSSPAINEQREDYGERFQRPSKKLPLPNPYTFQSYSQSNTKNQFEHPEDVIYAYFGVLKEASNMLGYSGGCGTIGDASQPYPYAFEMLTPEVKKNMTLEQFEESFRGIGHITFLQLHSMPSPKNAPIDEQYYMIEIEVITGPKEGNEDYKEELSYFAYYYGIVTVKESGGNWGIQEIDYYPEEFLCAPYHGWFYDATAVVQIVYMENLKIVDEITDTVVKDDMIYIYAYGNGKQYRFDFVRLTNGHDILINENIKKGEKWVSVNLLPEDWQNIKLSAHASE